MKMLPELEEEFWRSGSVRSMDTDLFWEAVYQAFKARLMRELVAGVPSVVVDRDGVRELCSPLTEADATAGRGGT